MYQTLQQKLKKIHQFVSNELQGFQSPPKDDHFESVGTTGTETNSETAPPPVPIQSEAENGPNKALQLQPAFAEIKQLWGEMQRHPPHHPRWQALSTEIHKQLRLAEVDVQFWAAAKQSRTAAQRGQQLCDRLITLMDYCDTGIKLSQQNSESDDGNVLP